MQGGDIWSLCSVCPDQHSPQEIDSLPLVETHHTQTTGEDQNTDHEYLLPIKNIAVVILIRRQAVNNSLYIYTEKHVHPNACICECHS